MSPKEKALAIIKRLREEGYESYLAGGCVRDMLLGKSPQDYDITTNALPDDIRKIFSQTIPVGAQFGVMLVMMDGQAFEVATFRHDGPYLDGRRPAHVRYGTLEEDILRRDFTVNGMVYDPIEERVIDIVMAEKISSVERFALSVMPENASKRTGCAWFGQCASQRTSDSR